MDEKTKFGGNLIWRLLKILSLKWRKKQQKKCKTTLKEIIFSKSLIWRKFNLADAGNKKFWRELNWRILAKSAKFSFAKISSFKVDTKLDAKLLKLSKSLASKEDMSELKQMFIEIAKRIDDQDRKIAS
eukprot:TCONS_00072250-protein